MQRFPALSAFDVGRRDPPPLNPAPTRGAGCANETIGSTGMQHVVNDHRLKAVASGYGLKPD